MVGTGIYPYLPMMPWPWPVFFFWGGVFLIKGLIFNTQYCKSEFLFHYYTVSPNLCILHCCAASAYLDHALAAVLQQYCKKWHFLCMKEICAVITIKWVFLIAPKSLFWGIASDPTHKAYSIPRDFPEAGLKGPFCVWERELIRERGKRKGEESAKICVVVGGP